MSARLFIEQRLVLASHNPGKLKELRELLADTGIEILGAGDLGLDEPEETGTTFIENARLKAHAAVKATGLPALADDSGLCVTALGGAPGLYSARWAGPSKDFNAAMTRVHTELGASADRSAAFVAVLVLAWPDGHDEVVEGRVEGTLVWPPRGTGGFGYDPMFAPEGLAVTFGDMSADEKRKLSHRARALDALRARCFP